ncbi:MAG: thioredoxin-dependent thiol peroxidase [Cellulomonas sp.]|uniref:thioredoxin-dependent thiol peroxidase n=1 Tax=Cellulomonas sp. TaxID=40001 RepID=UPI0019E24E52|nr:thioredoxin-dependent thiol peroxidase [Cellulomonas sp.]MBF0687716.1 thioredoxin-dependent thiol peroxidase [Cellulomonas sp.]
MPRLTVGDPAPDLTLPSTTGDRVSLKDLRGRSVVVYFYPAAGTPGCTKQACDFRDSLAPLTAAGYAVVGVSPDPLDKLTAFAEHEGLTFPLLSDPDHETLEAWGAWGEKTNYGRTYTGVIRSTVVVDPQGTVALAQYNVRATGHVAKLRRDLGID